MTNKGLSNAVMALGLFSIVIALFPPANTASEAVIALMALAFTLIGFSFRLKVKTISLKELLLLVGPIMMAVGLTTAAVCLFHNPRLYFWLGLGMIASGGLLMSVSNVMPHKPLTKPAVKETRPKATG